MSKYSFWGPKRRRFIYSLFFFLIGLPKSKTTPFWTLAAQNDVVLTCGLKKTKNDFVFVSTAMKRCRFAGLKKLKLKCPSCSCSGIKAKIIRRNKKRGRRRGREEEVPAPGKEEEEQTCG